MKIQLQIKILIYRVTRNLFLLFVILNLSNVSAQTFLVDGVQYDIILNTTNVQVVAKTPKYSGIVTIPSIVVYNSANYAVTSIGDDAFNNCGDLSSITIGNSVASIGAGAFNHCNGLTYITIPNSVTSIGAIAFYDCFGLTSVIIPNSVNSIESNTFSNCSSLISATIPNSVTSIGFEAFSGCSSLTTFNCDISTPLVIDASVFNNVNQTTCSLNVPVGSESAYQAATIWQDFNSINGTLITESFVNKNSFKIYPNPVSNILTIENLFAYNLHLEVFNPLGQIVLEQNQNTSSTSLNVSNLSKGLYLLNITSEDNKTQTIKFIKNQNHENTVTI